MPRSLALVALALAACPPPGPSQLPPFCEPSVQACPPTTDASSSSSGDPEKTTLPTDGIHTVTGPDTSSTGSSSSGPDGTSSTTDEPLPPPAILEHTLPNPLTTLGPIEVTVSTEYAVGVRMRVDDDDEIELGGGPDAFAGPIAFYSGIDSGPHKARFVAWRDDLESEVLVDFEVDLPEPGQGYVWESANLIGQGSVAAIAPLPFTEDGPVMVEFGTYYPAGKPRCYLRRRDAVGAWGPGDFVEVLKDTSCIALDLVAEDDGTLDLLVKRDDRWWLGQVDVWESAATPVSLSSGAPGETAHALAQSGDTRAVCGTQAINNPFDKLDGAVWVVGQPARLFDYKPKSEHVFDETLRDCVFDGNTLVGVGDAHGLNEDMLMDPARRHHLQLRLDLDTDLMIAHVGAELGTATQSAANAVAILTDHRVVTVGYLCGDACKFDPELWVHAPDGALKWYASLGAALAAPSALAVSPGGHVVLGGAVKKGPAWSQFWMGAYHVGEYTPVWTYTRDDAPVVQYAWTVTVGPAGHIYGGGVGATGFPAVAFVTP